MNQRERTHHATPEPGRTDKGGGNEKAANGRTWGPVQPGARRAA